MFKTQLLTLESRVVQITGNIESEMDGEKVLMNIENGKYYNLGSIGGEIWELISKPMKVSKLINILVSQYNVNQEECEEQVLDFLELLNKQQLIQFETSK